MEYSLIVDVYSHKGTPSADLIEQVGYSSANPLFKKPKFRRALIEYRKYGLYPGPHQPPIKTDAATELYYIQIRRRNGIPGEGIYSGTL